jgi:NAD(P)-dependent dehydrogenase (short-subunit alcohol dehydrogenase family)
MDHRRVPRAAPHQPRLARRAGSCGLSFCVSPGVSGGVSPGAPPFIVARTAPSANSSVTPCPADSAPARVVNVASVAGKLGLGPAAYVASKFGMVGLSEALDVAWSARDVRVSQVNPGFITTEGFPQTWARGTPVARLVGVPDDVARAILATIVRGSRERSVPRWYRAFVVARHTVPGLVRPLATRLGARRG